MTPEQITALAYETGLLVGDMPPLQRHAEAIERFAKGVMQEGARLCLEQKDPRASTSYDHACDECAKVLLESIK